MRLRAQGAQHPGQFHGDVAGPDDRHAIGALLEGEEVIRGHAQLRPGHVGHDRLAADRNEEAVGAVGLALDGGMARVQQARPPADALDAVALQIADVDGIQALDVRRPAVGQGAPVVAAHIDVETVIGGLVQRVRQRGRVPHHLLGHAAAIDTGPAQSVEFDQAHARAVLGGPARRRDAAAAAADDQQIVVLSHEPSRSGRVSYYRARGRRTWTPTAVRV